MKHYDEPSVVRLNIVTRRNNP